MQTDNDRGPVAEGSFINIDFAKPTGKTVHPQLFGAATGGLGNDFFADCTIPNLQNLVRSLNLPLIRLNALWMYDRSAKALANSFAPHQIANFVSNIGRMLPRNCTVVVGIQTDDQSYAAMQSYTRALVRYWRENSPIPIAFVECMNEPTVPSSTYNACFSGMMAGAKAEDYLLKGSGPPTAGYSGNYTRSLIASQSIESLGLLNYHQYLYCNGADSYPSDQQVCQGQTAKNSSRAITGGFRAAANTAAGTYAAALPVLCGEYSIECGAWSGEKRTQTPVGACFLVSTLMKAAATSPVPAWGAVWDLYNDEGAGYNLISSPPAMICGAQYFTMQRLIATMPGQLVSSSAQADLVAAWATGNDTGGFGVAIVNAGVSAKSGRVALSRWPGNSTGNATIRKWELSSASPRGATTPVAVSSGITADITLPPESVVILSP